MIVKDKYIENYNQIKRNKAIDDNLSCKEEL